MLLRLFLAFSVIPFVELALLIEMGRRLGTLATVSLVVLTALVGGYLARWQGVSVVNRIQGELAIGRMPALELLDGLLVLIGSLFLLTPGLLTDAAGLSLLIPSSRTLLRGWLQQRIETYLRTGSWRTPR